MRKRTLRLWIAAMAVACALSTALHGGTADVAAAGEKDESGLELAAVRSGSTLHVGIVTRSREDSQALFGQRGKPHIIEIYKGELLLATGRLEFG